MKKGFSNYEYESQEEISTDQFEDPSKMPEDERVKLRTDVADAMAEPETIEEEPVEAKDDKTKKEETEDRDAEKMETEKEEPSTEQTENKKVILGYY